MQCHEIISTFYKREKSDESKTITLVNGSLSGLLVHPRFILEKGKYFTYITLSAMPLNFISLDLCPMADKITQVEDFCTHSKILGIYQIS